jgi:NAD(P)-dependent dehydrogenase (short-subunit alcohol dehydrogenase family)
MTPERKVVVITRASRGIGAQLSKAYRPAAAKPNPLH